MKIVMAPVNIAGQPILLVREMQRLGIDARLIQFSRNPDQAHKFGYKADHIVDMGKRNRAQVQLETLERLLDEGVDVFHFWLRSMFFGRAYEDFQGFDLPLIKARDTRVLYRFTGFDLRLKSDHMAVNPEYNPFRYGYDHGFDEDMQRAYLDHLRNYVDQFVVQDAEMGEFMPGAAIVPRILDLNDWQMPIAAATNKKPLVVHSPSAPAVKGTDFVLKAVEELQQAGVQFDFKLIEGMAHEEAKSWYRKADIAIDQLLIGWYGVFALEAMALGKATIAYIRPNIDHGLDIPIHNANPDNIAEKLRELIEDEQLRKDLGERARAFVEREHDVGPVTQKLIKVYEATVAAPQVKPSSSGDIIYLWKQFEKNGHEIREHRIEAQSAEKKRVTLLKKLRATQGDFARERAKGRDAAAKYKASIEELKLRLAAAEEELELLRNPPRVPVWDEDKPKTVWRVVVRSIRRDGIAASVGRVAPYVRRKFLS